MRPVGGLARPARTCARPGQFLLPGQWLRRRIVAAADRAGDGFSKFRKRLCHGPAFCGGGVRDDARRALEFHKGERIFHVALPWLFAASGFAIAGVVHSDAIVLAALTLGWLGFYAAYGAFFSLPSSFLRGTAAAGGIALFNTIGSLGGFFGPSLFGVLKQGSGDYTTGMVAAAGDVDGCSDRTRRWARNGAAWRDPAI